jgi:hypothetical protein
MTTNREEGRIKTIPRSLQQKELEENKGSRQISLKQRQWMWGKKSKRMWFSGTNEGHVSSREQPIVKCQT